MDVDTLRYNVLLDCVLGECGSMDSPDRQGRVAERMLHAARLEKSNSAETIFARDGVSAAPRVLGQDVETIRAELLAQHRTSTDEQREFVHRVQDRINEQASTVTTLIKGSDQDIKFAVGTSPTPLVKVIQDCQERVYQLRNSTIDTRRRQTLKLGVLFQKLRDMHAEFARLLQAVMIDASVPATRASAALLCDRTKALSAKVQWLNNDVMSTLYSKENVAALRKLRTQIVAANQVNEKLNIELRQKLQEYNCLGPEFYTLAYEWAELLKKLKFKQDTLNQVHSVVKSPAGRQQDASSPGDVFGF